MDSWFVPCDTFYDSCKIFVEGEEDNDGDNDDDFDVEEWRRIFPDSGNDVTRPDPMAGGVSRADRLALQSPIMTKFRFALSFSLCLSSSFGIGLTRL